MGTAKHGGGPEYVVPASTLLDQGPEGRCRAQERLGLTLPLPCIGQEDLTPQEVSPLQLSQVEDSTPLLQIQGQKPQGLI